MIPDFWVPWVYVADKIKLRLFGRSKQYVLCMKYFKFFIHILSIKILLSLLFDYFVYLLFWVFFGVLFILIYFCFIANCFLFVIFQKRKKSQSIDFKNRHICTWNKTATMHSFTLSLIFLLLLLAIHGKLK